VLRNGVEPPLSNASYDRFHTPYARQALVEHSGTHDKKIRIVQREGVEELPISLCATPGSRVGSGGVLESLEPVLTFERHFKISPAIPREGNERQPDKWRFETGGLVVYGRNGKRVTADALTVMGERCRLCQRRS